MKYLAWRLGWILATPSSLLPLLAVLGLALVAFGRRRLGACLAWTGVGGILLAGFTPLPGWALLPLEQRFPGRSDDRLPVHGVILLSGSIEVARTGARDQLVLNDAAERFTAFLDLARRYPEARLVSTGGGWARVGSVRMSEAELAAEHLARLGLPRERILVETRSRNTAENAAFARALAEPRPGERWLLVTSAWHMPRAVGSFRQAGFPVTAYPVDYRTAGAPDRVGPSEGLRRLDVAAKEWLGLAVYRARGRTDALFPAPEGDRPPGPQGIAAAGS